MKTFKNEYKNLLLWYKEKTDECDKIPSKGGHDGGGIEQHRTYTTEFHKKVAELKNKYGNEPESTSSNLKSRKHKQIIQT